MEESSKPVPKEDQALESGKTHSGFAESLLYRHCLYLLSSSFAGKRLDILDRIGTSSVRNGCARHGRQRHRGGAHRGRSGNTSGLMLLACTEVCSDRLESCASTILVPKVLPRICAGYVCWSLQG